MKAAVFSSLVLLSLIATGAWSFPSPQDGKRLIKFSENEPGQWMTQAEIEIASSKALHFMDVTDHKTSKSFEPTRIFDIPTTIRFNSTVRGAIGQLDVNRIEQFMVPFTSFHNRYYTSESGIAASNWLYLQIYNFIASVPAYQGALTLEQFEHSDWPQKSIIVRIQGSTNSSIVVLGAHLDSVTQGAEGLAPGADDNASGSTTILEAFKTLLLSGFVPAYTLEFHWYAAEEVGLRGAQDIAARYNTEAKPIIAMLNFDMSGYTSPNDTRIAIIDDFTDPELNTFIKLLIESYNSVGWMDRTCGYGCSDHAAWNRLGYKSSFAHESTGNSFAHTVNDTVQNLDYGRIFEYSKLAIAFAIELAQPSV